MWTRRIALAAALAAGAGPAAANYTHTPFLDRPVDVAQLALDVLEGGSDVRVRADDVPLAAAVAAFLLVSEVGLAEAFETAVAGEDDDDDGGEASAEGSYAEAYALLQTIRPWVAAVSQDAEIADLMTRLDALMPTADRPARLDADPEAAEVVAQALVGQLERAADADLYLGRDLRRAIETIAAMANDACGRPEADREIHLGIAALYFEDTLEAPLSVMAAPQADEIERSLEVLLEGDDAAGRACAAMGLAFEEAKANLFPEATQ